MVLTVVRRPGGGLDPLEVGPGSDPAAEAHGAAHAAAAAGAMSPKSPTECVTLWRPSDGGDRLTVSSSSN